MGIEKARKMAYFRAFLAFLSCRLSLAELRCATSCFETVFLTLLHTRIAGQEASLLQGGAQLRVELQQGTGQAVADSASLACAAAANHVDDDIELALVLGQDQGAVSEQSLMSRPLMVILPVPL